MAVPPFRKKRSVLNQKTNKNSKGFLNNWLPVFLWALFIFSMSSIQQVKVSEFHTWDFAFKKLAHVTEYAILYALLFRATKGKAITSYLLTIVYAATDELHQSFVPGRTGTPLDLGFDASGANISAYLIWKLKPILQKKRRK